MARKEKNPVKTMMLIQTILIVAIIGIIVFWPQKNNGDKTGRILLGGNGSASREIAPEESETI